MIPPHNSWKQVPQMGSVTHQYLLLQKNYVQITSIQVGIRY